MQQDSRRAFGAAAVLCLAALAPTAHAQDFFSDLFRGFARPNAPMIRDPFGERLPPMRVERPRRISGGGQAYCVRTCDGRYFPIATTDRQSRAASCNNLCPAAETKLVYGDGIDEAETERGMPYSELPNAFRYRKEIVAGCTCNGKDSIGLASVRIEDDPTLRKGDIVAGAGGLVVVNRERRGTALSFSPVPSRLRAKYERMPIVAKE